jgi:hypothetical protein
VYNPPPQNCTAGNPVMLIRFLRMACGKIYLLRTALVEFSVGGFAG